MTIDVADLAAARDLLGGKDNDLVADLPGANLCYHVLAGSGCPAAALDSSTPFGVENRNQFEARPYRHHDYVAGKDTTLTAGVQQFFCKCGNSMASVIHTKCWEAH